MQRISEQISYLSGLCEGLNITEDTAQGKVLLAIIHVLDELNDEISQLDFDLLECQNRLKKCNLLNKRKVRNYSIQLGNKLLFSKKVGTY